jgi:hypothetical protein
MTIENLADLAINNQILRVLDPAPIGEEPVGAGRVKGGRGRAGSGKRCWR